MSIRDGLIVAGIVILVLVLADLIRRFLKRDKLRLTIDDQFKNFPEGDLNSELPNGGARAVVARSGNSPLATAATESSAGVSADSVNAVTAGATEHQAQPAGESCSEPETWTIDPILSGSRESDEQVDLLLELEFKGLGKGASHCMGQADSGASAKLSAALDADSAVIEAPDCAAETFADGVLVDPTAARSDAPVATGSSAAKTTLDLVADSDLIDLERPVHELLQGRHSARSASAADSRVDLLPSALEAVPQSTAVKPAEKASEPSAAKTPSVKHESQPSFFDLDPALAPAIETPAAKPKSRRRRKKVEQVEAEQSIAKASVESAPEEEVLVINVLSKHAPFSGPTLFKLVEACGLEFGAMDIFHRYEQAKGQGALQFSMANAVRPGTFDPSQQLPVSTPAVTFFLRLADPTDRMSALECMLATAQCVADNLGGELKDENRSSLRTQTIEHYRQKVREFERKALTRRS